MLETKDFAGGGLNTDVDYNLLNPSDWTDALNIRIGSPDGPVQSIVSNIKGNRNIMSLYEMPAGTNKIIGAYGDQTRNIVYCFLWNSNGNHRIFYIDLVKEETIDLIRNKEWTGGVDVLKFSVKNRILSVSTIVRSDEEGDLLYWTDGAETIRKLNVLKAKNYNTVGGYPDPIIENYIDVVKKIPDIPYNVNYIDNLLTSVNNLRRKLFQFRYRWVYDDLEKSPWGGWSDTPLPYHSADPAVDSDARKNCEISMLLTTGDATINKIELSVRQNIGNLWGDPQLYDIIDKKKLGLADNAGYVYIFTNNNAGTPIPIAEAALLFTSAPLQAAVQELVNGSVLLYGNITEGFDTPEIMDVTTTAEDAVVTTLALGDSVQAWKWGGRYRLGIVYYDAQGRTDGVHTYVNNTDNDFLVDIPAYRDDLQYYDPAVEYNVCSSTVTLTIRHQPPLWAKRYRIVRSQCLAYDRFSYYVANVKYAETGSSSIFLSLDDINNSIISNGQTAIIYDYVPGDRVRFLRSMNVSGSGPLLYPNTDCEIYAKVKDPNISGTVQEGTFLKLKIPDDTLVVTGESYLVEIYTPSSITDKILFYEFGPTWDIINPGTAMRAHAGNTNQDVLTSTPAILIYGPGYGDVYLKRYYKQHVVFSGGSEREYFSVPVQDMNFNEAYASAVSGNGRGIIEDPSSGRRDYPNMVRYGGAYQSGTNINQTNIFYPESFDEYDRRYGAIKRLKGRDREVRVFQELKVGRIPVYQQVIKDAAGNDVLAQSDKIINNIQYFSGDYGIGNVPESLAYDNFSDYFCDSNRGTVCRISQNGLTAISINAFNNSLYTAILPRYNTPLDNAPDPPGYTGDKAGDAPVIGVFDALHNEYIMAFTVVARYQAAFPTWIRTVTGPPTTRSYDEGKGRFISRHSYAPEAMVSVGIKTLSFSNGFAYMHDSSTYCNFYGVQYDASITTVFNKNPTTKKTFLSVDEYSADVWVCDDVKTEAQSSSLIDVDFQDFEGHKNASFLGDINSQGGILNGDSLKGGWIRVEFIKKTAAALTKLITVAVKSILSNENLR